MVDGGYIAQQEDFRVEIEMLVAIARSIANFLLPKF
jgi:hypothetical protein